MKELQRLSIIGGDTRQVITAKALAARGYTVLCWGLGKCQEKIGTALLTDSWEEAISDTQAVILPLPASADGVRIHCPLHDQDTFLRITALLDTMPPTSWLLGGRFSEVTRNLAEQKGISWLDYYESEILQLKNALPTAEGAISLAMQALPITLDGCSAAIFGYGRIGALLAEKLVALGVNVRVYARREESLAAAELRHCKTGRILYRNGYDLLTPFPSDCRVLFNTVPHRLLEKDALASLSPDCVLIELASAPGGYDPVAAKELGLCSILGSALPGKHTPESAGLILADTLDGILTNQRKE